MDDNKNTILAILLSVIVLVAWQYFVGIPQMEKQREQAQRTQQQTPGQPAPAPGQTAPAPGQTAPVPGQPPRPGTVAQPAPVAPVQIRPVSATREAALAASPRVAIETPRMRGSISLRGARIDDLSLIQYRETVDPKSPIIVLLSPSGSPHPFYAEFGWVGAPGATVEAAGPDTLWTAATPGPLTPDRPVTLSWDNGEGLVFTPHHRGRRRLHVHGHRRGREQRRRTPVTLYPYALISRHGTPVTLGYYILHEGLIGVLGDGKLAGDRLHRHREEESADRQSPSGGWLGITDKYWAATLLPNQKTNLQARFSFADARQREDLPDRLPRRCRDHRARREAVGAEPPVRRRQGGRDHRRLRGHARHQALRPADRLGLVLLHHQAAVPRCSTSSTSSSAISASRSCS